MGFTKRVEQYISTETIIFEDGVEVMRIDENDARLHDVLYDNEITDKEAEDYL